MGDIMTVEDLKELLECFPNNAEVKVAIETNSYCPCMGIAYDDVNTPIIIGNEREKVYVKRS